MTKDQLIQKIMEIKELARDISTKDPVSKTCQSRIIAICDDVQVDYQIGQRLEKEENRQAEKTLS